MASIFTICKIEAKRRKEKSVAWRIAHSSYQNQYQGKPPWAKTDQVHDPFWKSNYLGQRYSSSEVESLVLNVNNSTFNQEHHLPINSPLIIVAKKILRVCGTVHLGTKSTMFGCNKAEDHWKYQQNVNRQIQKGQNTLDYGTFSQILN